MGIVDSPKEDVDDVAKQGGREGDETVVASERGETEPAQERALVVSSSASQQSRETYHSMMRVGMPPQRLP